MPSPIPICPVHEVDLIPLRADSVPNPTTGCVSMRCPYWGCDVVCGTSPYSMPAPRSTVRLRAAAHKVFDKLWLDKLIGDRNKAYYWLADVLGLTRDECHFGKFSAEQCENAIWHIECLLGPTKWISKKMRKAKAEAEPPLTDVALPELNPNSFQIQPTKRANKRARDAEKWRLKQEAAHLAEFESFAVSSLESPSRPGQKFCPTPVDVDANDLFTLADQAARQAAYDRCQ